MVQNVNGAVLSRHHLCVHLIDLSDKFWRQQFPRRSLADDFSILYRAQPVTVEGGNIQVVDRGNYRAVQPPHQIHQLKLKLNVQMVGGFVKNQAGRLLCQRPRQDHPLLLTAGEGGKGTVRKVRHADGLQRFRHDPVVLSGVPLQWALVRRPSHQHHIPNTKVKVIVIMLRHHSHLPGGLPVAQLLQGRSVQIYRTRCGL